MVDINSGDEIYLVRFKEKDKRQNKRDDKFEVLRSVIGLRDTSNVLDLVPESERTRLDEFKKNTRIYKDDQTVVDINLFNIPSVHIKLNKNQAARLRRHPDVRWVQPDQIRMIKAESVPWGISRVQADSVDSATRHRGMGVRVGECDSGIDYTNTDLKPNYKGGISLVAGVSDPKDDNNLSPDCKTVSNTFHGTHVAGTIAAAINNFGVVGVAPEAWLYSIKTQNQCGAGSSSGIAQGIIWGNTNGMNVFNCSVGGLTGTQDEIDAVHNAYIQNRFVSAASGNESRSDGVDFPGAASGAWAVGATDITDTKASFSNFGKVGDVKFAAPGVDIISDGPNNTTHSLNGTSMATPHVAGIAALAFANYRLSPCDTNVYPPTARKIDQIVGAMISSCDTLGQSAQGSQSAQFGWGIPQVSTMIQLLLGF